MSAKPTIVEAKLFDLRPRLATVGGADRTAPILESGFTSGYFMLFFSLW